MKRSVFYATMIEMNDPTKPYGSQPKAVKKVWDLMWNIFEDVGANEYTTWVWEVTGHTGHNSPSWYFPKDPRQVDYIGLSSYSRSRSQFSSGKSLSQLSSERLHSLHRAHPDKPIIYSEMGKTIGFSQPGWFESALKYIVSRPEIVGLIPWDNYNPGRKGGGGPDDHTITDQTYARIKEIFADPFWIGAETPLNSLTDSIHSTKKQTDIISDSTNYTY